MFLDTIISIIHGILCYKWVFAFEGTRNATAATVIIESSSFDEERGNKSKFTTNINRHVLIICGL